ncbi:TetR/AcrR family transcriptional regulator [Nocardia cyriacigeorgica]|uniref:TetR/AcrR family transcriptional regulator n=1 Tax=Nocardia cyriacigeorgica TaxID=135487 RepID=A0A6P1DET8_9NOCA|nr:TetR/AcrR family transcriptional regulator [Nocardia cyriacigeorgica]NEW39979.1 TetR/AcrR family transcriptional regulator [Nocardia cyriacigeorgica]NEW48009.1 TetR/AcrR family transcriptional regulator [Nocardia cyriacigeorgica]NEW53831.1 TetR/AcrR family transcriptional regulator [Nocardia cyriacigeorgica]NEW59488.1 TetR/AcrR family transcriptional regulator [Nocardia cyriacigeorgica]
MPRVSEEHLERRRQQILAAAQRCFSRKGFYNTSMQDVFAESGLSAGAVYRYFKSKDELVAALASNASVDLRAMMAEVIRREPLPTPAEVVHHILDWFLPNTGPEGRLRLAPQAWSLALVDPDAAVYVRKAILGIREMWTEYIERMIEVGWLPEDTDKDATATAMFGILPGFLLQQLIIGDFDHKAAVRGMETLFPFGATTSGPA